MTNKSIEFVKNRIESGLFDAGKDVYDFSKAITFSPIDLLESPYKDLFTSKDAHIEGKNANGNLLRIYYKYNPDGDFSYMSYDKCFSDGTILFTKESMDKLLWKVLMAQTIDKSQQEAIQNPDITELHYEIGDIVNISEYGDWYVDPEKPWLHERVTNFLPIKTTIR